MGTKSKAIAIQSKLRYRGVEEIKKKAQLVCVSVRKENAGSNLLHEPCETGGTSI